MKLITTISKLFIVIALLNLVSVNESKAQNYLSLADSLGVWNSGQTFTYVDAAGVKGTLFVSNKLVKRKSTTCIFTVEIQNIGDTEMRGYFMIGRPNSAAVHVNNSINISLKPNTKGVYKMELRECLPKGAKGMTDRNRCSACQPLLMFSGYIRK